MAIFPRSLGASTPAFLAWLAAIGMAAAAPALAQQTDGTCVMSRSDIAGLVPQFEAYPVEPEEIDSPAPVDFSDNPDARLFRTTLTRGAAEGPNFAGHYTIVGWSCGSTCFAWGMVDATTGQVHFAPGLRIVSGIHVDQMYPDGTGEGGDYGLLRFRRDSSLLVVIGMPGEEPARDGIAAYRWTGDSFRLLTLIQRRQVCRSRGE